MYKSVIVVKNKGLVVPDEVLAKALETHKSFFGMAVAENGVIVQHKMKFAKDDKKLSVEDINKVQNHANYKDKQLVMAFGAADLPTESGTQPFSLVETDTGKSTLVMFMDGNFEEFAKTGSARSASEFAYEDYFKPKFKKEAAYADNDLKKIMEQIRSSELSRDFAKTMLGDRGSLVFLAGNGDLHAVSVKGDATHKKNSWGWISDTAEEKKTAPKEEPKTGGDAILAALGTTAPASKDEGTELEGDARRSLLDFSSKVRSSDTKPARTDAKPDADPKPSGGDKSGDTPDSPKTITFEVPSNLLGAGEQARLKKWLRNRLPGGILPKDYATRKTWTIEYAGAPKAARESAVEYEKSFSSLGDRLAQQSKTDTAVSATSVPTAGIKKKEGGSVLDFGTPKKQGDPKATGKETEYPDKSKKDVSLHHVGKPEADSPAVVGMSSPIIPPAEAAEMKGIVKSQDFRDAISLQGKMMENPKEWTAYEATIPSFAAQVGLTSIEETEGWSYQSMLPMTQSCPKAVLVWGHNWKSLAMKLKKQLEEANKDIDELLSKDGRSAITQATSKEAKPGNKLDFGTPKRSHAM